MSQRIHSYWFTLSKDVDDMFQLLSQHDAGCSWRINDSEYFGRYIKGKRESGTAIRIELYEDSDDCSIEVYLADTESASAHSAELDEILAALGAIGATSIRGELKEK